MTNDKPMKSVSTDAYILLEVIESTVLQAQTADAEVHVKYDKRDIRDNKIFSFEVTVKPIRK